jgi:hypothetical protein
MAVSLLAGLVFWTGRGGHRYLAFSAVAAGLALLTKIPAVTLVPAFLLTGHVASRVVPGHSWVRSSALWLALAAVTAVACWPALWDDPLGRLADMARFAQVQGSRPHLWPNFFLGQALITDPGPWFYPVAMAIRLSPVTLVGLVALALVMRWRPERLTVVGILGLVLLFAGLMSLGAKKFDRYLLPVIMLLDLLAGAGLAWAASRCSRWLRLSLLTGALAAQVLLFVQALPYLLTAYNPMFGGISGAQRLILVGWGEGLEQAAAFLNSQPLAEQLVVTTHYHDELRTLFRGQTVRRGEVQDVDYCVVYVNMLQRDLLPQAARQAMMDGPPVFTFYAQGVQFGWIYALPRGAGAPTEPNAGRDEDYEEVN